MVNPHFWIISWIVDLGIWSSVLALRIDFRGLLANVVLTRLIVSTFTDTFACLPVCGSKDLVSQSVLSHLKIALWPGGSTFHVRWTCHCTRVKPCLHYITFNNMMLNATCWDWHFRLSLDSTCWQVLLNSTLNMLACYPSKMENMLSQLNVRAESEEIRQFPYCYHDNGPL